MNALHGFRDLPVMGCAIEGCTALAYGDTLCARCREEIDALESLAANDERKPLLVVNPYRKQAEDATYAARQAEMDERTKQFFATFLFVLAVEGLLDFAFGFPFSWAWLAAMLGWAFVMALVVAAIGAWSRER